MGRVCWRDEGCGWVECVGEWLYHLVYVCRDKCGAAAVAGFFKVSWIW